MILKSTVLRCDASNRRVSIASANDELSTWQTLEADEMLRPASNHLLLSALVGNGLQLVAAYALLLCCACLGFLSPDNRGGLVTCGIVSYLVCAPVGGCVIFGLLRQKTEDHLTRKVLLGSGLFPGVVSVLFVAANCIHQSYGASSAVPWSLVAKVGATQATIGAAARASRKAGCFFAHLDVVARKFDTRIDGGPKLPPCSKKTPWYLRAWFVVAVPPLISFSVVFVEIFFVYSALWHGMVYYVFGFLAAASFLWVVSVACTAVVFTYFSLKKECAHWWWVAFAAGSGFGLHWMLYSWYFFAVRLHLTSPASVAIFGLYSTGFATAYGLAGGAVGVTASWMFVKALYSNRIIVDDSQQPAIEMTTVVTVMPKEGGHGTCGAQ